MCDFRSRKRLHEADSFMDGSLLPLNSGMDESSSLFHHGEVGMGNSSSMMSPDLCPSSMESTEELRHLLMCATIELETAREAASAQGKLHEARVRHLEELLRKTSRERDEAREQCHQLQGRLSRSPSRNGSALVDNASNAVNAAVEADLHQKQILEELQKHLELQEHSLTSTHIQMVHQDQHMEDGSHIHHLSPPHSQIIRHDDHMDSHLEDSVHVMKHLNAQSPESHSSLHPSSQMQSPENHYTMNGLQDLHHVSSSSDLRQMELTHQQQSQLEQSTVQHQQHNHFSGINGNMIRQSTDGQLEQESERLLSHVQQQQVNEHKQQIQVERQSSLHQQVVQKSLPPISVKRHCDSPSRSTVIQQHQDSPSGLSVRRHRETPLAMSGLNHRDSPTAMSVMQHHRDSPTAMSGLQHRDSPSTRSFMQRRESPCISMSVMQHPAWQAVPGENSPYSSPGLCSPPLSNGLGLPSVNLHSGSAVASLLSPLDRFQSLGVSSPMHLASRPVHLPEPPESDLQVMLKSLPEKGKLLQAVMQAGPLLQTLLVAGPLPQWRHPPPALDTLDIPRVSMSSSPSCDMSRNMNTGLMAGNGMDQTMGMYLPAPIPTQERHLAHHLSLPRTTMSTGVTSGRASQGMVRVNSMGHLGPDMRMLNQPLKYAKIH
ncbi:hypothetical protein M758_12G112100 [Ceratodon purpureus]|nr:hypothetical protein M758_12G112100 [Ceratodon purpureus]